ncbi:hypothetical protein CXG81DRAFT_13274 [Caulochytrium protostelioides]|uniref:UBC core domain-containing protein n=1 Tax=Caulochytrium protostelioides TaxID=1555241 RepID=A0A4P9X5L8_9FUNG|nr:hypothetical protein CXG81DRAFT_13274 [Caulochytrium protostelioides]|eukprot:RKP00416.1 hypothetical protein CXG81DRAFT_13274 [Caulochytrium protostelioides]
MGSRRLAREFRTFEEYPPPCPVVHSVILVEENLFEWSMAVLGPAGSPYEGGIFRVACSFPENYPFNAPTLRFMTRIYHPNVDDDGSVCLGILKSEAWKPANRMVDVMNALGDLLLNPVATDALRTDIGDLYQSDRAAYNSRAAAWARDYASA